MVTANDLLPPSALRAEEEFDSFIEATLAFEEAAEQLDLEEWIVQRLRHAERELTVHVPIVMDHGEALTFTGFRVQHSTVRGPAIGGVRLAADIHLGQVKALAMAKSWQCALLGLPFGGSAGAIICDPAKLSERELRALIKDYVYALGDIIGPFQDVLTRDADAPEHTTAWMADAHARARGHAARAGITGLPPVLGGLPGDHSAIGRGVLHLVEKALMDRKTSLQGQRVAVQGFGAAGASAALCLSEAGARVIAVSDLSGGLHNESGLDIGEVQIFAKNNGMLFGYPGAEAISNEEVLEARCDILIPAAAERQITAQNARQVHAGIVLEVADSSVTRAADKILESRNVQVIPDLLGNAGGAVAAFLEWARNARCYYCSAAEADDRLKVLLQDGHEQVSRTVRRFRCDLRRAAYLFAIDRVAGALRLK